ncbi:hypothetical protein QF000_008057 [Paraburkholderia atlantica]|uniref:hypothetical protein n=1 Tax=Paraburkholderia atlantica TaxID=2654982 RepID=UPI003D19B688
MASDFDRNVGFSPMQLAQTTSIGLPPVAVTASAVQVPQGHPFTGTNDELVLRSGIKRDHQSKVRHLGKWLEQTGRGTLADILNSSSSTYANQHVRDWLDLPHHQNPYGRDAQRHRRSGGGGGGGGVTGFRKAFGWGENA